MATKKQTTIRETEVTESESPTVKIAVMNNDMKHFSETLERIEGKFDTAIMGFVTHEKISDIEKAHTEKHNTQDRAIAKLEEWNVWATRIVLGAVILAILGIVFAKTNNLL